MPIESPKIEPEPEEKEAAEVLKVGDEVRVLRSSGEVESGWDLSSFNPKTGEALVSRKEGDKTLLKEIPQIELYALNRPTGETRRFPLNQWARLWNSTEVSHIELKVRPDEGEIKMNPEEAKLFLREKDKKGKGRKAQMFLGSEEERIGRLKRRIALFGSTPYEEGLLKLYENEERKAA